jgi:hypothetical protein
MRAFHLRRRQPLLRAKGTTRSHPISAGTPRIVAQWKSPIPNTARMRVEALPPVTKYVGQLNGRNQYCNIFVLDRRHGFGWTVG